MIKNLYIIFTGAALMFFAGCDATDTLFNSEEKKQTIPTAISQSITITNSNLETITLRGSDIDGDSLTYHVQTSPTHGTLSGIAPNLTYIPNANYAGVDSFTFMVNDGTIDSDVVTINLVVKIDRILTKSYDWDSDGVIDSIVAYDYDMYGNVVKYSYDDDANGVIDSTNDAYSGDTEHKYNFYTYTHANNALTTKYYFSESDPNIYDDYGNILEYHVDDDANNSINIYTYNSANGTLAITYDYDNNGTVESNVTFLQDTDGHILTMINDFDNDGSIDMNVTYDYNDDGNVLRESRNLDSDDTMDIFRFYTYDTNGSILSESYDWGNSTMDINYTWGEF